MNELWKSVEGTDGLYEVSNTGKIRSLNYGNTGITQELKVSPERLSGYVKVRIKDLNGNVKVCFLHRLIAKAFIPNPDNLPCVNHKDEDKANNNVCNLEWCTYKYNSNYGTAIERANETKKMRKNRKKFQNVIKSQYDSML